MDTRSSPRRARRSSRRGMPALPTQKAAAAKKASATKYKKKAPTAKQIAAAKEKTKQREMEKVEENQPPEVKQEILAGKRRMWTEEEDIAASKAYVNITTDPVAGAQQNRDDFWMRVQKKMYEFLLVDAEVADVEKPWSYQSVKTRISKTIGKQTQLFNGYYIACAKDNDSGWTKEMHMEAACNLFIETEGRAFKFRTCARILHGCPKFQPTERARKSNEEDEDTHGKTSGNPVASIQGKGLQKPLGTKKAKKLAIEKKLEAESVATAAHTEAVLAVAKSAADLHQSFDKKRRIDSMHKSVDAYLRLGDIDKARKLLEEIEALNAEDDRKPAATTTPASASLPTSINFENSEDKEEDQESNNFEDLGIANGEGVGIGEGQPTFKSMTGAINDSSEEELSNHSQSDDSKLVKRLDPHLTGV